MEHLVPYRCKWARLEPTRNQKLESLGRGTSQAGASQQEPHISAIVNAQGLQHQKNLTGKFIAHPWKPDQGSAVGIVRILLILPCLPGVAAADPQQHPTALQPTSSISRFQVLVKAALSLLGLRMEYSGTLSKLRLTLVVMAWLNKRLLQSECDGRTAFLLKVCSCRKCFVEVHHLQRLAYLLVVRRLLCFL